MVTRILIVLLALLCILINLNIASAAVAGDCTLYVSATGVDTNSGSSLSAPKSLTGASSVSKPGDVICVMGGTYRLFRTFYPQNSGTANAWIVYKNYGDGDAQFVWAADGNAADINMFHLYGQTFPHGKSYIEIRGLKFDGNNVASTGIKCAGSHHLRLVGNTIYNTGQGGISTKFCDYVDSIANRIYRTGYNLGWSSGISYNSHQWYDRNPGFHSVVVGNMITENYDNSNYHTEGLGIIIDLSNNSYDYNTADTPPSLVANNVVYGNGGRCILTFVVSNVWVVNNTCYKNTLDLNQSGIGEFAASSSKNVYFINNISYAWNNHWTYEEITPNQNIVYYKNIYFGGNLNVTYSDISQFINKDPLFSSTPNFQAATNTIREASLPPERLGNSLTVQPSSPAVDAGIDPTTIPGFPREIVDGLRQYVMRDAVGATRPCGKAFDIGAYEFAGGCLAPPPAPTSLKVNRVQ